MRDIIEKTEVSLPLTDSTAHLEHRQIHCYQQYSNNHPDKENNKGLQYRGHDLGLPGHFLGILFTELLENVLGLVGFFSHFDQRNNAAIKHTTAFQAFAQAMSF